MSLTPNSPADFSPTLGEYSGQGAFRFWCQQVLPITFDDSLSYYELLNKVVTYLNNVISDVSQAETNIDDLLTAYNQLQNYVNEYFDNLDVQEEINHKMDELITSGYLPSIFAEYSAPIFVSSVFDMTDRSKLYILASNAHIYNYNSDVSQFIDTGVTYGANTNAVYQNNNINSNNYQTLGISSIGDLNVNSVYGISETITEEMVSGLPTYGKYGTILVIQPKRQGVRSQTCYLYFEYNANNTEHNILFNIEVTTGNFSGWKEIMQSSDIPDPVYDNGVILRHSNLSTYNIHSINDLRPNCCYALATDITETDIPNLPQYGRYASICTLNYNSTNKGFRFIFYATYDVANMAHYYLGYSLGTTPNNYIWVDVNVVQKLDNISNLTIWNEDKTSTGLNVIAVGDSICAGRNSSTYSETDGRLIVPANVYSGNEAAYEHDGTTGAKSCIGLLRKYLADNYSTTLVNNGIGGISYRRIWEYREYIFSLEYPTTSGDQINTVFPDIAIIFLGSNNRGTSSVNRPLEIPEYLPKIVEYLRDNGVKPIIITNIDDLRPVSAELACNSKIIANIIKTTCSSLNVDCYDLNSFLNYTLFAKNLTLDTSLLPDNLHPNDTMHNIIFECMKKLLLI